MKNVILTIFFLALSFWTLPNANAANLLANSGFEDGLNNWTTTGNATIRMSDPLAHQGTNYVYGVSTPLFTAAQTIGLLGVGVSEAQIDSGGLFASFGGWQSGWHDQTDHGTISIHFLDAAGAEISASSLSSFYSDNTWVEQSGTALVPVGTRSITYQFIGESDEGDNDDGYLDDADLEIVPEAFFSTEKSR